MDKMDDLKKICDKLENCSKSEICYKNEIVCTKSILKSYIGGDENKRLRLKAQIKEHEKSTYETIKESLALVIATEAFVVSCVPVVLSVIIVDIESKEQVIAYVLILIILLLILAIFGKWEIKRNRNIDRWKNYIQVVLEDMDNIIENKKN